MIAAMLAASIATSIPALLAVLNCNILATNAGNYRTWLDQWLQIITAITNNYSNDCSNMIAALIAINMQGIIEQMIGTMFVAVIGTMITEQRLK